MLAYRDNRRTGGDTIMAAALYGASDADIRALAHYLAGCASEPGSGAREVRVPARNRPGGAPVRLVLQTCET